MRKGDILTRGDVLSCECGCGQPPPLAQRTNARLGYIKSQPHRFVSGHNRRHSTNLSRYIVDDKSGCWIWQGTLGHNGYGQVKVNSKCTTAHRAMYEATVDCDLPRDIQVDHRCDNRRCVNPAHLRPVTSAENVRRRRATKLTTEIAAEIRKSTDTAVALGARFGVARQTINEVRYNRNWVVRATQTHLDFQG